MKGGQSNIFITKRLPNGWRWEKLGEICEFLDSKRVPINEKERQKRIVGKSESELYPYYGANGQVGWIDDYLFNEPLLLLAEDGGFFGSNDRPIAYKISGRTWVNNHAHVLRAKNNIDLDYCHYALAIRPDVGKMVTGNTRPKLNQDIASQIPIPLPPLPEQKRIAAILTEQFAAIEKARTAAQAQLEEAKALPAAYLREVFPKPGEELPAGWKWVKLGEVCKVVTGGTPPRAEMQYFIGNIPWIKPEHLNLSMIIHDSTEHLSDEGAQLVGLLPKGSVLVSCIGKIGKVAVAGIPLTTNQQINSLVPNNEIDSYFLYYCCKFYQPEFEKRASSALVPIINKSIFSEIQIPLPSPDEQKRISALLKEQLAYGEIVRKTTLDLLENINVLPSALLRKAFNGEL